MLINNRDFTVETNPETNGEGIITRFSPCIWSFGSNSTNSFTYVEISMFLVATSDFDDMSDSMCAPYCYFDAAQKLTI